MTDTITLNNIQTNTDKDFEEIYKLNMDDTDQNEISPYDICPTNCRYYEPIEYQVSSEEYTNGMSFFPPKLPWSWVTLG